MDAADEADLRLARRLRLGVRLVLYPLAIGLIAIALHKRHARSAQAAEPPVAARHVTQPAPPSVWKGWTSTVSQAWAWTDGDRLFAFSAVLEEPCANGETFTFRWDGPHPGLTQRGRELRFRQPPRTVKADDGGGMTWQVALDGRVGERTIEVTLSAWVRWRRRDSGQLVRCALGPSRVTLVKAGG